MEYMLIEDTDTGKMVNIPRYEYDNLSRFLYSVSQVLLNKNYFGYSYFSEDSFIYYDLSSRHLTITDSSGSHHHVSLGYPQQFLPPKIQEEILDAVEVSGERGKEIFDLFYKNFCDRLDRNLSKYVASVKEVHKEILDQLF